MYITQRVGMDQSDNSQVSINAEIKAQYKTECDTQDFTVQSTKAFYAVTRLS